jgi:LCP family protein required for cell wall assembly
MKIFNKYTYLFLGILLLAGLIIFNFLPDLNREEFDQEVIDNIVEGVTTTTIKSLENENDDSNKITPLPFDEEIVLSDSEESNIQEILKFNSFENKITGFDTYLLIGSDERSPEIALTRGSVNGKRADVIILGLVSKETGNVTLLSFPRDLLIKNSCTEKLERINASYVKNECGGRAENLAAAIYSISGIKVDHFASFDFEGFEEIIDSVDGIEICVDETQREGYSFELQKGCQTVSGLTTLNWIVSRSTEVLVGEKVLDDEGNDISEWELKRGVSDLTRIERQQYVVMQLINELKNYESFNELNSFVTALESSFTIDENLSLNKAVEILWKFRNIDINNVSKVTTSVDYLTLEDGRQVLTLNKKIYDLLKEESVIDS